MKITQVEFFRAAYQPSDFPSDSFLQIAFAGRSNVGKSSLINTLLQRGKVAHISSQPGKTRSVNFIRINRKWYFVDLPGYGYAKVSREEREHWKGLIETYFAGNDRLRGLVQIVDARIGLTDLDREMLSYAASLEVPLLVVATKCDKLKPNALKKQIREIGRELAEFGVRDLVQFSAKTKIGRTEILSWIYRRLR